MTIKKVSVEADQDLALTASFEAKKYNWFVVDPNIKSEASIKKDIDKSDRRMRGSSKTYILKNASPFWKENYVVVDANDHSKMDLFVLKIEPSKKSKQSELIIMCIDEDVDYKHFIYTSNNRKKLYKREDVEFTFGFDGDTNPARVERVKKVLNNIKGIDVGTSFRYHESRAVAVYDYDSLSTDKKKEIFKALETLNFFKNLTIFKIPSSTQGGIIGDVLKKNRFKKAGSLEYIVESTGAKLNHIKLFEDYNPINEAKNNIKANISKVKDTYDRGSQKSE